jgi:hypothetical protein
MSENFFPLIIYLMKEEKHVWIVDADKVPMNQLEQKKAEK